ncbi:GGDEF domain-containing protein [Stutzerimonas azotifigens]|uniref:diguanylate cyclase n=1 Tax=Stutzerimonas azotifigens TaxID=291995 RepID=A0ABR5YVY8_9GAMM|nr:GGDEF domain-containing protein [Stutzerimonas azotifigens]MBA1272076.1 GGDEF domain-containing protein [Stutzerimonas azotifigens]
MGVMRDDGAQQALQLLLLKRFGMAAGTYALALLLTWLTVVGGFYQAPASTAVASGGMIVGSQLVFLYFFRSGLNLRFEDPSLTEPQVLVGLLWLTYFLAHLGEARGSLIVLYILVLLFAAFSLRPLVFVRCAALAFCSYAGLNLWDHFNRVLVQPKLALLEACVLLVMLVWMSLFVSYLYQMRQRMRQRRFALQAHQETLRGMMRQLEDLASTDELTGLFNRRHFIKLAEADIRRLRPGHRSGLALIDLDHFKRINDVHGHATGDLVLQCFASIARGCLREGDILARYGGEEFVLLLPDTEPETFTACCERLREAFAAAEVPDTNVDASQLSLSVGMTLLNANDDLEAALQHADEALYEAKRSGRNRCQASWGRV